jgi:hypothetical protein
VTQQLLISWGPHVWCSGVSFLADGVQHVDVESSRLLVGQYGNGSRSVNVTRLVTRSAFTRDGPGHDETVTVSPHSCHR